MFLDCLIQRIQTGQPKECVAVLPHLGVVDLYNITDEEQSSHTDDPDETERKIEPCSNSDEVISFRECKDL